MKQALDILQTVFGYPDFRKPQDEIINHVVNGGHALVLMPTGGGKSLCYQIPALLRDGLAIVVSPLIALMQDQVAALQELGVVSACLNSATQANEARKIAQQALSGELKLLYVAPERLLMPRFLQFIRELPLALFAIDEAHCVSQWGHDFRPEYQQLAQLATLYPQVPRIALTATADEATRADILHYLQLADARQFVTSFDRANLFYQVVEKHNAKKQLLTFINAGHIASSGIVYCLSRKRVETIASWLSEQGINALPYHAGLSHEVRDSNQRRFLREDGIVMVATIAFGMGIDKPDVRFVAHLDMPKSPESFYQESGRAGRDGLSAVSWLCYGLNDMVFLRQMISDSQLVAQQKQIELDKLNAMLSFCETANCRRQYMLQYFAEEAKPCGNCDNCQHPPQTFDATLDVQKLLSCIYRVGQSFAASHVIDVLRGKNTELVERYCHQNLSTFAIGKHLSERAWRAFVRQLLALKLIDIDTTCYQSLRLTNASRAVLKGEQQIYLRPLLDASKNKIKTGDEWLRSERQEHIWQALRVWRKVKADEHNVPAYVVFSDRALRELVERQPKQLNDLRQIYGFGEAKLERYGEDLLGVLNKVMCSLNAFNNIENNLID